MARNAGSRSLNRTSPDRSISDIVDSSGVNKNILDNVSRIAADNAVREVGVEKFTCYLCGELKSRDDFYRSTDTRCVSGVTRICKECASKIAHDSYEDGEDKEPTADSIHSACEYLDYSWLYAVYSDALKNSQQNRNDIWSEYIRGISNPAYEFNRFKDSDVYNKAAVLNAEYSNTQDTLDEEFEFNRRDVIRLVGYDPFENYPITSDLPRLYAQLISFIDEETKSDGMKMGAVIQIVKKLNQAEKINAQIDFFVNDYKNFGQNVGLVDRLASSSQKLMSVANALAKDNGISVNFNNNKSAGASTLSGKIKKLTEIGLRSAKINTFDIGTCEGMRQVAEINEETRHKRIGYDENIASEIKDIKVELVERMTKERDEAKETARLLLQENKDLKEYLKAKGLIDEDGRGVDQ